MSSKKVTQFISIIILIAGIVIAIFVYSQYKSNKQGSDPRTETKNQTSATGSSKDTTSTKTDTDEEQTTTTQPALSSKETLLKFLEILTGGKNLADLKTYSTTTFYQTSLISGLVSGKTTPPMSAQIVTTSSTTSTKVIYQVKEEYNISKTNNSGSNGIYLYTIVKENNKWLVSSKTD